MKLKDIERILNSWLKRNYPSINGLIIIKNTKEPAVFGSFVVNKIEVYLHTTGRNRKLYQIQETTKKSDDEDLIYRFLEGVIVNLSDIGNEIIQA